jgi:hypothetical protein
MEHSSETIGAIASLASSGISLELELSPLVLEEGGAGRAEHAGEFRPGAGSAHVNDADRFDPRSRRLNTEQTRRLAVLDAAPKLLFRGQKHLRVS